MDSIRPLVASTDKDARRHCVKALHRLDVVDRNADVQGHRDFLADAGADRLVRKTEKCERLTVLNHEREVSHPHLFVRFGVLRRVGVLNRPAALPDCGDR